MVATVPEPMLIISKCYESMSSIPGTGQALWWEGGGVATVSLIPSYGN